MLRRTALAVLSVGLVACGGVDEPEEELIISPLPQARLAMGAIAPGTYVMRSQDDVTALAATTSATLIPADFGRLPTFDFANRIVVAVSYGIRGACAGAEFTSARRRGERVVIGHRKVEKENGIYTTACGLTHEPWTIFAAIPRGGTSVEFELLPPRLL